MAITFPNATLADAPTTDVSPDVPPVANPLPGFVSPTSAQVTDPLAEQVEQPEEAPPVVDLSAGIPQSFVYRPPVEFSGGENPWDRDAREHAARMEAWREEETPKVNLMATDPDKAFKGMDLKWARSVKEGQRLVTNDVFMRLQLDGNDVPTSGLPRAMVRRAVANRMFDGKGGESEDAFHAQIIGHFQKLGFDDAIGKVLADNGQQAGIMQTAMPGAASNPKDWQMTRDAIKNMPGYSPDREADFHSMFHGAAMASRAMMQPFAPELREIWGKMKQGEQGTVSSTLVAGFRALAPTGDGTMPVSSDGSLVNPISAMATEAGKEDAAATAFRVYKAMPEDQRTEFMSALGLMAKSFPADERNGFFANMAKSGARAMDGLPREALSAFMSNMLSISDMGGTIGSIGQDGTLGGSPRPGIRFNTSEGAASQQAEFMARHNFSADVRRIQDEAFNPVLNTEGKAPGGLARAAYAFPGLMAFTAEAELPGIGLPLMFLSMQTQANDQLRQNLIQGGMKEEAASHLAGNLAPFVALPQAALMKANAGLWLGKLPMFEKVFDRIGDQFTTTITRLVMRAAAADVTGQAIMEGMSLVPHITQQVVHALDSDVPDVQWGGKGGVFDGFWPRTFEGMATLAPLAILGAAGGISADARAKAFAAATPKELAALGWKPDAIDGRAAAMAKGLSSMGRLIDVGMLGADPHSEGAQTAADELIREHMGKTLLAAQANDSGLFPDLVHTRDGWIVKDRETGKELGQAPDISGAMKIVETHYAAFDDLNEHHVAYITSLMEAAQESRKLGGGGDDHSISMELDNAMTEAKMAMENPAAIERFQKQVELKERLNGGDGSFANAALGVAVPGHDGMGPEERLFQGADVTTTFHETFHRLRREARAAGRLTRADEIAVLRSLDKVMGGKRTKEGPDGESEALRFLPDGIDDADITDMMLDEGCGEIGSMQILKSRKGGGPLNIEASTRANPNFITRNLLSIAARVSP